TRPAGWAIFPSHFSRRFPRGSHDQRASAVEAEREAARAQPFRQERAAHPDEKGPRGRGEEGRDPVEDGPLGRLPAPRPRGRQGRDPPEQRLAPQGPPRRPRERPPRRGYGEVIPAQIISTA